MSHHLGDLPPLVELAGSRRVVRLAKFVPISCNVGLRWQIGGSQEPAAKAKDKEEQ
jgi:hypothetical protein